MTTAVKLCFSIRWAGSNKQIASSHVFYHNPRSNVLISVVKLQSQVAQLVNATDPSCIKILMGSPAGPQLTPPLRSHNIPSEKMREAYTAIQQAWASLGPDTTVDVFVTQHHPVALAISKLCLTTFVAHVYESLPQTLRCNPSVAMVALVRSTYPYRDVKLPLELQSNKQFALAAMRRVETALTILHRFARTLGDDEDVVLAAVGRNKDELLHASTRLKSCKTFVLKAVSVNGLCIQWAAPELKQDSEVAQAAVQQNKEATKYLCSKTEIVT